MKKTCILLAGLAFLTLKNQAQTVSDYDGNLYDTVNIGSQVWLKQNLKVTHYNNGELIPNVTVTADWDNLTSGARCYYTNDSAAYDTVYGALYNGYAVNNSNRICPEGWHVPTSAEWESVEIYLGGADVAGGKMKEEGTLHWASPNTGATNSSRFTGIPGGMRDPVNHVFSTLGENGLCWTSSQYGAANAWSVYLWYLSPGVDHNPAPKRYGLSIRCIKDVAVGVGETKKEQNVNIFPNPAYNKVQISVEENKVWNLRMYDASGRCVLQDRLSNPVAEIDISALNKGIYIVEISYPDRVFHRKLLRK